MKHAQSLNSSNLLFIVTPIALGCVLISLASLDIPLARAAHEAPRQLVRLFDMITKIGVASPWFALCGAGLLVCALPRLIRHWSIHRWNEVDLLARALLRPWRWHGLSRIFGYFFISLSVAGAINTLAKMSLGRARPGLLFSDDISGFYLFQKTASYLSFPSGHTQVIFTVATALALVWPRGCVVYYTVAGLVALSRIMVGAHYPSDVVAGAFVGAACAILLHPRIMRSA